MIRVEGDHPILKRIDYVVANIKDADDGIEELKNAGYEVRVYVLFEDGEKIEIYNFK